MIQYENIWKQTVSKNCPTPMNRDLSWFFEALRHEEKIRRCQGPVMSVAFNLDASLVATGSYDRLCKLWRVEDGVCVQSLVGHSHLDATWGTWKLRRGIGTALEMLGELEVENHWLILLVSCVGLCWLMLLFGCCCWWLVNVGRWWLLMYFCAYSAWLVGH